MTWPTIFANLAGGNQPLSLFDTMFNQVAQMVAIPSAATGTNAISLTPIGNAPTLTVYQNFSSFRFIAPATTTGLVTAQFQALGFLPVYLSDGVTQASTGSITINLEYVLVFAQFLNAGAGGFFLEAASVPANPAVGGSALTNLLIANNAVTPNTQINVSYDELVMNNTLGTPFRATAQSFVINAANAGVVNGLDTGALANSTWYAVYGISNGATNGGLLSLSFSTPTMPSGYTFRKRIGAFRTDGSAHFLQIRQQQRRAQYVITAASNVLVAPNIANGTAGTYDTLNPVLASVSVANFVPPTAIAIDIMGTTAYKGGAASNILVAPNTAWGGTNNGPLGSGGQVWPIWIIGVTTNAAASAILLLETSAVAWASGGAGGAISCLGWEDNI